MKKILVSIMLASIFFNSGCGLVGIVTLPTRHEKKITAEYDLGQQRKQKLLVLVNQPVWLNAEVNLRSHLLAME